MSNFFLTDRVKETSRTVGGGDILLDGAVQGFSAFEDFYSDGDTFYYAVTDGSDYEVGSGVFTIDGSNNTIVRFPVQSTNANALVNFNTGVKEVFVTYAGFSSVYSASGIAGRPEPAKSGIPFWSTDQIISYNPNIIWDDNNNRIGVYQENPKFALEVGGTIDYSVVRASGFMDGGSGILFSGVAGSFSGGRQLEPFLRNQVNNETGTDAVIEYSGLVSESILFVKQIPNTVFAGPQSDCGCVSDYPTFRALEMDDLPADILAVSGWADATMTDRDNAVSGWADATMTDRDNAVSGWTLGSFATKLQASGSDTAVSGWARAYVDSQFGDESNFLGADSGVRKVDNTYTLDPFNSGTLLRLGLYDDGAAIIGVSGGHGAASYTDSVFLGTRVSENSNNNVCSIILGNKAGINASGNNRLIAIGCDAGSAVRDSDRAVALGNEVADSGYNLPNSIFVGNAAGKHTFGLSADSCVGIGNRALQQASGNFAGTIAIGVQASRFAVNTLSGIYIGQSAGTSSLSHDKTVAIGTAASNLSQNINNGVSIGRSAGLESSGNISSIFIGTDAGAFASGISNDILDYARDNIAIGNRASFSGIANSGQIAIGYRAGEQASGIQNIYIGQYAGFKRGSQHEVIIKTINGSTAPTLDSEWRPVGSIGTIDIEEAIQGTVKHPGGGSTSIHIGQSLVASDTAERLNSTTFNVTPDAPANIGVKLWPYNSDTVDIGTQSAALLASRPTLTNTDNMTLVNGSGFLCTNDGSTTGVAIFNKALGGNYLTYGGETIPTDNIKGTIIPCRYGSDTGIAIATGNNWLFISGILV